MITRVNDERAAAFFKYLATREQARLRKEAGLPFPWVDDDIISTYKFTNVFRAHDRTTRWLIDNRYKPEAVGDYASDNATILFMCAVHRYFGTTEIAAVFGWHTWENFPFEILRKVARSLDKPFTGAYVVSNFGLSGSKIDVIIDHVLIPFHAHVPAFVEIAEQSLSWEKLAYNMADCFGFAGSGFMTKETLLDTFHTSFWNRINPRGSNWPDMYESLPEDFNTWTPVGPGSKRGASLIWRDEDPGSGLSNYETLQCILELHRRQHEFSTVSFPTLLPTDIQFGLCEFDKYERARSGRGKPRSRYKPVA